MANLKDLAQPGFLIFYISFTWYTAVFHFDLSFMEFLYIHFSLAMVLMCLYKATFHDPGYVPFNFSGVSSERFCDHCNIPKPPRAHHCRTCSRCVFKFDHHCPFTMNCVGFGNYKYYLLLLFYAVAVIAFVVISRLSTAFDTWEVFEKTWTDYLILVNYVYSFFMLLNVSGLAGFHLFLISKGISTVEWMEKGMTEHEANKGLKQNLLHIFGTEPLLWLFPVFTSIGDGYETKTDFV